MFDVWSILGHNASPGEPSQISLRSPSLLCDVIKRSVFQSKLCVCARVRACVCACVRLCVPVSSCPCATGVAWRWYTRASTECSTVCHIPVMVGSAVHSKSTANAVSTTTLRFTAVPSAKNANAYSPPKHQVCRCSVLVYSLHIFRTDSQTKKSKLKPIHRQQCHASLFINQC